MRCLVLLALAGALTVVRPTFADDGSADEAYRAAIARGRTAKEAFDAGRYEEARRGFAEADAQAHSPVFVLYRARSERALGQWLKARASLQAVAEEALDDKAPAQWHDATRKADEEYRRLDAQIPRTSVRLEDARGTEKILVDDRPYAGGTVDLDPGSHLVVVERDGTIVLTHRFEATAGDRRELVLDVPTPPTPKPVRPPPPTPKLVPAAPAPSTPRPEEPPAQVVAGYVLLGVGGLGLVTGAITGGLALERAATARECGLDGRCDGDTSVRELSERLAHTSTAAFAVAGASTLASIILLTLPVSDDEAVSLSVGLGTLAFTARY